MKRFLQVFLIVSLAILCLFFILYVKYRLNSWCDSHIDKTQSGLRVFYYGNEHFSGNYEETEIVKGLLYSSSVDKKFQRKRFSLRAVGVFSPPRAGYYKFFLRSDDGSRLYVDQDIIIDNAENGGVHPSKEICKTIFLKKVPHLIIIEYFQVFGEAELDFSWLKTRETEKSNDLELFFRPATSSFQWDKGKAQFEKVIKLWGKRYIFFLLIGSMIIFIWFILRFWKKIYFIGLELLKKIYCFVLMVWKKICRFLLNIVKKINLPRPMIIMLQYFRQVKNQIKKQTKEQIRKGKGRLVKAFLICVEKSGNFYRSFYKEYFSDKTKIVLFIFAVLAPFITFWMLFHLPSSRSGSTDPHLSYINMTNMYIYFLILLLVFFARSYLNNNVVLIALFIAFIAYPFLFIHSRCAETLNLPGGNFPYFKAILASRQKSWLSHPWLTFTSTHPYHIGSLAPIEPLLRTKLPGFTYTAKALSYFVFNEWTYMISVVCLTLLSYILFLKALFIPSKDNKWYVLYMFSITTFLIQPFGVEQICTFYLALCIFSLFKFKQKGNIYWLLVSVLSAVFLLLNLHSASFIVPFIIVYAFLDNKYWRKMLIYGFIYSVIILLLLSGYFKNFLGVTLKAYYVGNAILYKVPLQAVSKKDWVLHLKSSLLLTWIIYGPLFLMLVIPLIFKPKIKLSILIFAAIAPLLIFNWIVLGSEAYRQHHINCAIPFVVFLSYLATFNSRHYSKIRQLYLSIFVASSVLYAIMFHKIYRVPDSTLTPLIKGCHDCSYGLMDFQKVTPIVFLVTFFIWIFILIFQNMNHE